MRLNVRSRDSRHIGVLFGLLELQDVQENRLLIATIAKKETNQYGIVKYEITASSAIVQLVE